MKKSGLEPQELKFSQGEAYPVEVSLLAYQYANVSSLAYRLQVFAAKSPETVHLDKTGTASITSLEVTITLTTGNTTGVPATEGLEPDHHSFILWDTVKDRRIAFGDVFVTKGLRS